MTFFSVQNIILTALSLFFSQVTYATTIAIFDNKINIDHPFLKSKIFINQGEIENNDYDDDLNGYNDDVLGWNFNLNKSHTFESHSPKYFSEQMYLYYDLKSKKYLGTITQSQETQYKAMLKNSKLMDEKKQFTKYAHGTHIACLALGINDTAKTDSIKILPVTYLTNNDEDEQNHPDFKLRKFIKLNSNDSSELKLKHIENYLQYYRSWLITKFDTSIKYSKKFSKIINASWGQSYKSTSELIEGIYEEQFDQKASPELVKKLTHLFMTNLLKDGKKLISNHNEILFIFSAGNTNSNNDETLHYPSGIKLSNTLSIGATYKMQKASFSNYGKKSVDLFYPGVAISSCTPDEEFIKINGTSQSAAQASYAAALVMEYLKNSGKSPTPANVIKLLIKTAQKVEALKEISLYGGQISLENIRQL